ncbi:MAG: hypothetical protein KUL82_11655 [Bdellovibrio sp.]|uniref:hypothetical protein n=1 Tax=Bdellovibrio sp. TaxID=28201 RepID=UPI0039E44CD7|nr:hypothetical protein [Bdellovibrio sp.]
MTNIDPVRLSTIEQDFKVSCLTPAPFAPNSLVEWKCKQAGHQWMASYIDLQIYKCYQCDPQDIEIVGNGSFAQSMSFTVAKLASDFSSGKISNVGYLHNSNLHASIAAFFFTAVRNEFCLKVLSKKHPRLGLGRKRCLRGYQEYNTVGLVENLYKVAEANISKFSIPGMDVKDFRLKFLELKKAFVKQIEVRNKIAHGFSFYPVTNKKRKYNSQIANEIKSLGAGELENAYAIGSTFMAVAEKLIDDSPNGIKLGNHLLRDYILLV